MPNKIKAATIALPVPTPETEAAETLPVFKAEEAAKPKKTKPFIVLPDKKGDIFKDRIQINDDNIKHVMMCNDTNVRFMLVGNATGKKKEQIEAISRFPMMALVNDGQDTWLEVENNRNWNNFVKTLKDYKAKIDKAFEAVKVDDAIDFYLLPMVIRVSEPLAVFKNNSDWVCLTVTQAKMEQSFFGPYLRIRGNMLSFDGKEFQSCQISHSIYEYEGTKKFIELGIKIPKFDEKLSNMLIERGKKYVALHRDGSPKYMAHTGTIVRRSYWRDNEYAANGRIMVDRLGMRGIDPDYEDYFGNDRYRDNDDDSSVRPEEFTDQSYMCMSPFCYGFSFVAKQWGEMRIDNISEITFNDCAYDKLVLNEKTKDILFSLVDAPVIGKDLIEGKGGGCIFLLHGHPGLGK